MRALLVAHVAILLGWFAHGAIAAAGLRLPLFVPCLLVGIVMSNTIPALMPRIAWPTGSRSLAAVSDLALSIFLAMSLMSMQLWTLSELGLTLLVVLGLQVVMAVAFILLVVFRAVGRGYLAAVLSAGFAGFALGATPTAIANMTAVTKRYGPAPLAFIVLPLVSVFFVDLVNAVVIQLFVSL
ncbi:sodium/glutamate symporter [Jannaschia marina]|uniref:sodium/glutamate symporter n=1 Tax=Jannaschia marina TaxID=2741674 RepID=UPI0022A73F80|nr:sodium/glutamate symporter [Jannaschia marina]